MLQMGKRHFSCFFHLKKWGKSKWHFCRVYLEPVMCISVCHLWGAASVVCTDTPHTPPSFPQCGRAAAIMARGGVLWAVLLPSLPLCLSRGKTSSLCCLTQCCCLLITFVKLIKFLVAQLHLCLLQFYHWACPQTISSESLKHLQASSTLTCHELSVPKPLGCCWIAGSWTDVGREEERGKLKYVAVCVWKSARH